MWQEDVHTDAFSPLYTFHETDEYSKNSASRSISVHPPILFCFCFHYFNKEVVLELHFEGKRFYCDLAVKAVRSSRSPEALQQVAIICRSFICMLYTYIRTINESKLKFNPVSSQF
jgi:hypothetical protein